MECYMTCLRNPCARRHPCEGLCSDDCSPCEFPMDSAKLPCGHIAPTVPWFVFNPVFRTLYLTPVQTSHLYDDLASVYCLEQVEKEVPFCEHSVMMACSTRPDEFRCTATCGDSLDCCGGTCKSQCGDCTAQTREGGALSERLVARTSHSKHPCERALYCQHMCGLDCSQDHKCNVCCQGPCRQKCEHRECPNPCGEDCGPCYGRCGWICPHGECPVACGSVGALCSRVYHKFAHNHPKRSVLVFRATYVVRTPSHAVMIALQVCGSS